MDTTITQLPRTLGELKASGWRSKAIKQELHDNLLRKLAHKEAMFPGIVGYEHTVLPRRYRVGHGAGVLEPAVHGYPDRQV